MGVLRKSLTYLDLFSYRIISTQPDPSYTSKIGPEADLFYNYSNVLYSDLGNRVLKDVYGYVEII